MALIEPIRKWIEDIEWCAVCGAETPQDAPDGAPVPHKAHCALAMILDPAPTGSGDERR